jgi:hypothetical protein
MAIVMVTTDKADAIAGRGTLFQNLEIYLSNEQLPCYTVDPFKTLIHLLPNVN